MEKTLMLKAEGKGWQRMGWLDSTTGSMGMNLSKLQEIVKNREAWHAAEVHRVTTKSRKQYAQNLQMEHLVITRKWKSELISQREFSHYKYENIRCPRKIPILMTV